jgi:hypothetical protein
MSDSDEKGLGKLKAFLSLAQFALILFGLVSRLGMIAKLSDEEHAILATLIFAFFIVYVVADMMYWRGEVKAVWVIGPVTILIAAFWWAGFMHMHHIPKDPLLPESVYPPKWAYILMFAWLALYCAWDIIDARINEYRDEWLLVAGAVILFVGATLCLYLTLTGPRGV